MEILSKKIEQNLRRAVLYPSSDLDRNSNFNSMTLTNEHNTLIHVYAILRKEINNSVILIMI